MSIVEVATCIVSAFLAALAWYCGERAAVPGYVNAFLAFLVLLLAYTAGPSLMGGG